MIISSIDIYTETAVNSISHFFALSLSLQVFLDGPVCMEEFTNCRALGRVFLRTSGKTIALGIITRIIEDQE
jgi:translation elongation factor EF-1alpha